MDEWRRTWRTCQTFRPPFCRFQRFSGFQTHLRPDSRWRKWRRELDYRLIKELWGFRENRMAVRFVYEWYDDSGNWFRSHGNELWLFDSGGYMAERHASINDAPISEGARLFRWPQGPRPAEHPGLSEMEL